MPKNSTPKVKRPLEYICKECQAPYQRKNYVAPAKRKCDACQGKAKASKRVADRKDKVAVADEFLWIASEIKRSGTLEVLHWVESAADLRSLVDFHLYYYKCYGWDASQGIAYYHRNHIQPVEGADSIGLLHPLNLFVGRSWHNQKQGVKPGASYAGLSIARSSLKAKWKLQGNETHAKILDKVKLYLGPILVEYLDAHSVKKSQRIAVAERVHKLQVQYVYDEADSHMEIFKDGPVSMEALQKLPKAKLTKMEATITGKPAFKFELTAKRSLVVYYEELQRMIRDAVNEEYRSVCKAVLPVVELVGAFLAVLSKPGLDVPSDYFSEGLEPFLAGDLPAQQWQFLTLRSADCVYFGELPKDVHEELLSKLRDWIGWVAFDALQGNPVNVSEVLGALSKKFNLGALVPQISQHNGWSPERRYSLEDYERLEQEVTRIHSLLQQTGLASETLLQDAQGQLRAAIEERFAPPAKQPIVFEQDDVLPWDCIELPIAA
ncbi:hypothetical protein ACA097_27795 [Pseudomonas sp. QL9]|uniref:hypothetical protein n=1 Tax=Pseudomonas sp. QL9 TaxID=3242725 RepID=UPI00352AC5BE